MTTTSLHQALETWRTTLPADVGHLFAILSWPPAMLDLLLPSDQIPADMSGVAIELTRGETHFCA